jgi:hypothetical protein
MTDEQRPPEPRVIDVKDPDELDRVAAELKVKPSLLTEAIAQVGCNRTAVELWLTAPRA